MQIWAQPRTYKCGSMLGIIQNSIATRGKQWTLNKYPGSSSHLPQSTILSMWLQWSEVKHGRNHLIADQWCEPLTSAREITIDVNDSQGTLVQSTENESISWCRTPNRFYRSKVNDVNLCWEWENLSLRNTYLKVLNFVSKTISQMMSWCRW